MVLKNEQTRAGVAVSTPTPPQTPTPCSAPTTPRGVPGLASRSGTTAVQCLSTETFQRDKFAALNTDGRGHLRPVPVGLRRNLFGSLKKAEAQWRDLLSLFCSSDTENHLENTCKSIIESVEKSTPYTKQLSELYSLSPSQLKTVAEVFNPNRFGPHTDSFGLRAGQAYDIELGWDLLESANQRHVTGYLKSERPGLVILSPPCTKFSTLQNLRYRTRFEDPKAFDKHLHEIQQARQLLQFCSQICLLCHKLGLTYIFEHPWGASSWSETCLSSLVQRNDTYLARVDQCMFNLKSPDGTSLRKRSGFLTNSWTMAQALNRTCAGDHVHQPVIGKVKGNINLSRLAQRYPEQLIDCILQTYSRDIRQSPAQIHFVRNEALLAADQHAGSIFQELHDHVLQSGGAPATTEGTVPGELFPLAEDAAEDQSPPETRSFPGTHPLSLAALVRRAHEGLGHPSKERFLRILKYSKASERVLELARGLQCTVCARFKRPAPSRQGAPPREIGLNEVVGIDTIQLRVPWGGKTQYCANIIDFHSHFQLVVPLQGHTARATREGYRQWIRLFGPPKRLLCDLGREFKKEFTDLAEADGTEVVPSSLETPEQRGLVERHGQIYKDIFYKVVEQYQVSCWTDWYEALDASVSMKNRLASRGGYSPAQRVFGFQQRLPGGWLSDGEGDTAVRSRLQAGDVNVQRSMELRKLAAQAFHEVECAQAIRAAATHGPRPYHSYETGQLVFFWRRGADAARRPANAYWHGPARVVATQLPTTVWLAHNGFIVKAAPEKLRPAAEEEQLSISGWLEGISNVWKQIEREDLRGYIDLSKDHDEEVPDEETDYWRRDDFSWVRVHVQPRRSLFNPAADDNLPFDLDDLNGVRKARMILPDGTEHNLDDRWSREEGRVQTTHSEDWTGETSFILVEPHPDPPLERSVPTRRFTRKARPDDPDFQVPEVPPDVIAEPQIPSRLPESSITGKSIPSHTPPESTTGAAIPGGEIPMDTTEPSSSSSGKRDYDQVDLEGEWEPMPDTKRSRLQLLELYHLSMADRKMDARTEKRKNVESLAKDFVGKDAERLQRAMQKEVNNNLATGAYEILSPEESARVRQEKSDKIMRSRYVLTKKPIEDHALEDARSADEVLDSSGDAPRKAKCRHVMVGFSETGILDLETTTPQVNRDSWCLQPRCWHLGNGGRVLQTSLRRSTQAIRSIGSCIASNPPKVYPMRRKASFSAF